MHSDFNITSGLETPKARYLSLNDVRVGENNEKKSPILRCASLQWLTDEEKSNVLKRSKNVVNEHTPREDVGDFENALRLFNAHRLNTNEEEDELEKIEQEWGKYDNEQPERHCSSELEDEIVHVTDYNEINEKRWCQCSKENISYCVNAQGRVLARKNNAARKIKNVMSTLNEEVIAETKCERCHLEIRDETRKKEKIIELWMQFFG